MSDLRRIDKCEACAAPIVWSQTSTGRRMPVDAAPVDNGNVLMFPLADHKWLALVVSTTEAQAHPPGNRYVSHFATCKDAAKFRKARVNPK